jgi:hypothetical protein
MEVVGCLLWVGGWGLRVENGYQLL